MFRFSIEGDEWILRFSPQVIIEDDEKQPILLSLLHLEKIYQPFRTGMDLSCLPKKLER